MSKNNPTIARIQANLTNDSKRSLTGVVGTYGTSTDKKPQRQSLTVGTLGVNTQRNGKGTQPSNKAPQRTTNTVPVKNDRNTGTGNSMLPSTKGSSMSKAAKGVD